MIYRTPLCYQSYSRGDFFMSGALMNKVWDLFGMDLPKKRF